MNDVAPSSPPARTVLPPLLEYVPTIATMQLTQYPTDLMTGLS